MQKLRLFIGSARFFYGVVIFFIVEALYFALTARYPMAADEDYHFGLIKLHAEQWLPFFTSQPEGPAPYGAVVRDPSYLFHYIMSGPYRLVSSLTDSLWIQVTSIRLIDIGFVVVALVLFRLFLLRTTLPSSLVNLSLAVFSLVPIAPFVAAHINYDNLFLPCVAATLLLAQRIIQTVNAEHALPIRTTIAFVILGCLASIVKFPYLAVFGGVVIYLLIELVQRRRKLQLITSNTWWRLRHSNRLTLIILTILFIFSFGLFAERYAINLERYHSLTPECDAVISVEQCKAYGPWARNYRLRTEAYNDRKQWNIFEFTGAWVYQYMNTAIYALNGPDSGYSVIEPLPQFTWTVWALAAAGVAAFLWQARSIWRLYPGLKVAIVTVGIYIVILWLQNYSDFKTIGYSVAQQGRYLLPILPLLLVILAVALNQTLNHWRMTSRPKPTLLLIVALLLSQGGGALLYAGYSDASWHWGNPNIVEPISNTTHKVVQPFIIGR